MDTLKAISIQKVLKTFVLIFLGTMILTVSAKIKIPFYPVPMTMQTFVVLFLGLAFGYKIGLATVAAYLLEGIIGIPVFSNSCGFNLFYRPNNWLFNWFFICSIFCRIFKFKKKYFYSF